MKLWSTETSPIWHAAIARRGQVLSWPFAVLLVLLTLAFVGAVMFAPKGPAFGWGQAAIVAIGFPLGVYCAVQLAYFLAGVRTLRSTANAMLVPNLLARSRRSVALALAASLLPWLAIAAAFPAVAPHILAAVAYLYALLLMQHKPSVIGMLFMLTPGLFMMLAPRSFWFELLSLKAVVPYTLLGAGIVWYAFHRGFPARTPTARDTGAAIELTALLNGAGMRGGREYQVLSARDVRAGSPGTLLMLLFGASNHRYAFMPWMVGIVLVALVAESVVLPLTGFDHWWVQRWLTVTVLLMLVMRAGNIVSAMRRTAAEQMLFRLTPRAPASSELNRVLAKRLLCMAVADWVVATLALLAVSVVFGFSPRWLQLAVSVMLMFLITMAWPLRDYARNRGHHPVAIFGIGVVLLVLAFLSATAPSPVAWAVVQVPLLLVTLGTVAWRWRVMTRAPVVFPAGRMAQAGP